MMTLPRMLRVKKSVAHRSKNAIVHFAKVQNVTKSQGLHERTACHA